MLYSDEAEEIVEEVAVEEPAGDDKWTSHERVANRAQEVLGRRRLAQRSQRGVQDD